MMGQVPSRRYWDEVEELERQEAELMAAIKRVRSTLEDLAAERDRLYRLLARLEYDLEVISRRKAWLEIHWDEVEAYYQTAQGREESR